jgi:hypothetical protein
MTPASRTTVARWVLILFGFIAVPPVIAGCSALTDNDSATTETDEAPPGTVRHVEGTDLDQVVLTADAATRLGIATQLVREEQVGAGVKTVMSYAAILYDASGDTWVYVSREPLVFVRERITVESIEGDRAILSSGPAAGTSVVTVGATELYGTEFGVSGDE